MTREDAVRLVEQSLSRPSATPNTSELPQDEFLARERDNLRACLIEPIPVSARPGEWAIKHAGFENRPYHLFAVAKFETRWLLYDPASRVFYKAWSESENGGQLFLLGFFSDDALAEWNG
jgi:hypothetical protein